MSSGLQAILLELDRLDSEARELVEGLSDAQVNWQPREGKAWSIAQCFDHLGKTNVAYVAAMRSAVSTARQKEMEEQPIQVGWLGRFFLRLIEPPPRGSFSAPKKILPASSMSREEALRVFWDSHNDVRALIHECARVDLNRIRFQNPFARLLKFTVGTGLLVMPAHDRRHLWQAGRVRQLIPQPTR
jgi:hypothetical protein